MSGRIWRIIVTALIGCAVLIGLGVWQLHRLDGKQMLIHQIETRKALPPISLDQALAEAEASGDVEYLPLKAKGRFDWDMEFLMLATLDGNAAWRIITPFRSAEGVLILVDRGVVPEAMRQQDHQPSQSEGEQEIFGYAKWHRSGQGIFTPDNDDAGNYWYWWDVPAMFAQIQPAVSLRTAPFVLHLPPVEGDKSFPRPLPLDETLRNNHLQYALTWFALAAVLAVVAAVFIRSQLKHPPRRAIR